MTARSRDFKSLASTDFAIRAAGVVQAGYTSGDVGRFEGMEAWVGIEPAYAALQAAA
jgi:hypothetical protein